ncbi:PREDICTED: protein FAM161A isoform X2 [Chrysochloris asiatica]|uniref:Protein FAM161A n=1 Tax=Chrysochloris asiatica TaxID=185453 RepID=A0A9B0WPF6_CHRAS|nr:PREDICTED: protein FAM161A isoform X2 [Chrysochloris asiatica]
MDASHREAKLVASSHQVPLNPNTGARVAQYEREDLLGALATAAVTAALKEAQREEPEKTLASADFNSNFSGLDERTHLSLEDKVNFSDIYHSNAAYFKKLEELKAAHMETMAKLEKMYQNQLNLKGVQPVIIREDTPSVSSRSDSEKSYPPVSLMTSFSEPDLGRSSSIYPSSSEDELRSLEREHSSKSRVMTYAKELINNMWKNFSVEDYIWSDDADIPLVEKIRKKPKEWVPKITVPEPFQMMIREQKKRDENMKSKSDIEMIHRLLKKQEEDDVECQKKFRANPVPAYVFLPRYHDIVKQNEERRRAGKAKSKEALLASQKPFKFIAREEQKQAAREKQRDIFKPKKKTNRFKARPIPRSIYGPTANDRLKEEEELIKNLKTPLRAQDHSQNPSLLPSRPAHRNLATRTTKNPEKRNWKHKVKCQSPDVENLPEKCQKYLLGSKSNCSKFLTGCKPFDLHAPLHSSCTKEKVLADTKADEENSKETCWPYLSPRHKSPVRIVSSKPVPCGCNTPRPTVSSREREQAIRRSKKERMREYQQELEEREEKLKKRPLLFERVAQKNARLAAEKHYSNTLKALGICDEFVSKKGQAGKILEYFSNQEMTSFTEEKESFNEDKIEEREKRDENYLVDINSQESCKEKDEISEESGEENSVEE